MNPQFEAGRIVYLTPPMHVSMSDWYYDLASVDHFWVRRRFDVLQLMAGPLIAKATHAAEIGCGNGVLQRLVEDCYGIQVAGFELNEVSLEKNVSRLSPLYYYDIHQRAAEFRAQFDLLFLFDVLEHIEDESAFLQSIKYHMTGSGILAINVPAHQFLFSGYDRIAGHYRRYSIPPLTKVLEQNGFKIRALTYWGLPLAPLLLARKAIVKMQRSEGKTYTVGFDPGGTLANKALGLLARCEPLPHKLFGTSLMMIAENN